MDFNKIDLSKYKFIKKKTDGLDSLEYYLLEENYLIIFNKSAFKIERSMFSPYFEFYKFFCPYLTDFIIVKNKDKNKDIPRLKGFQLKKACLDGSLISQKQFQIYLQENKDKIKQLTLKTRLYFTCLNWKKFYVKKKFFSQQARLFTMQLNRIKPLLTGWSAGESIFSISDQIDNYQLWYYDCLKGLCYQLNNQIGQQTTEKDVLNIEIGNRQTNLLIKKSDICLEGYKLVKEKKGRRKLYYNSKTNKYIKYLFGTDIMDLELVNNKFCLSLCPLLDKIIVNNSGKCCGFVMYKGEESTVEERHQFLLNENNRNIISRLIKETGVYHSELCDRHLFKKKVDSGVQMSLIDLDEIRPVVSNCKLTIQTSIEDMPIWYYNAVVDRSHCIV